jgi:hypothetical protein
MERSYMEKSKLPDKKKEVSLSSGSIHPSGLKVYISLVTLL